MIANDCIRVQGRRLSGRELTELQVLIVAVHRVDRYFAKSCLPRRSRESGRIQHSEGTRAAIEVGTDGSVDPLKGRTLFCSEQVAITVQSRSQELAPSLGACALGHMPIHYHETHGLFDGVVGGLDFRVGDGKGSNLWLEGKSDGDSSYTNEPVELCAGIAARMQYRFQGGIPDLGLGGGQGQSKSLLAEFGARWRAPKSL